MKKNMLLAGICGLMLAACASAQVPLPDSEPAPGAAPLSGAYDEPAYYVRSGGSDLANGTTEGNAFKTLSRAIQAASSGAIKTIVVIGTLKESIVIADFGSRELFITGKSDAAMSEKAVLTTGVGPVLTVGANSRVHFEHIEIAERVQIAQGGSVVLGAGASFTGVRGGVLVDDAILELRDNAVITGIASDSFGAVCIRGGGLVSMFDDAQITGNTARSTGNTASAGNAVSATQGDAAQQKIAGNGGAVYIEEGSLIMRGNAVISENKSDDYGGAVVINTGSLLRMWDNALISENTAGGAGGGVVVRAGATLTMRDWAVISNNKAPFGGGVMVFPEGVFKMYNNAAVKNNAAVQATGNDGQSFRASGGGVYNRGTLTMQDAAVISANTSVTVGGGVYLERGTFTMQDMAALSHNSAGNTGGGVQIAKDGLMTMRGASLVSNNRAIEGGGFIVFGRLALYDNASISGNTANYGNGIYIVKGASATRTGETVTITDAIYREEME